MNYDDNINKTKTTKVKIFFSFRNAYSFRDTLAEKIMLGDNYIFCYARDSSTEMHCKSQIILINIYETLTMQKDTTDI